MTTGPVVGIVGHRYLVPRPHVELDVTGTPRAYVDRVAAAVAPELAGDATGERVFAWLVEEAQRRADGVSEIPSACAV
jgi:hypothetical protein